MNGTISKLSGSLTQHSKRGTKKKPEGLHSKSLQYLDGGSMKHQGVNITTPDPLSQWTGEVIKTSKRASTMSVYLGWKHHGVNITTATPPPLPPGTEEVLKTSQRACTVRAYLGWKHHEVPWSEYYNSTPSPHGWERYLKQGRGSAQWELILVGSTIEWILQLHPPPYSPSLHGMLVHHSIAHQYVAINFNTKLKICACVCVLGGGGVGGGNLKKYFACERKSSDGTVRAQIRTPWYSVWCDHHPSINILEKRLKPQNLTT